MNCDEFREQLVAWLSAELSADQLRAFDAHRDGCPDCRRVAQDWQKVHAMLRAGWPSEDPLANAPALPVRTDPGFLGRARQWFAFASMGAVAASMLLLVLLRPSVEITPGRMSFQFGSPVRPMDAPAVDTVTQEQVRAWVQVAFKEAINTQRATLQQSEGSRRRSGVDDELWGRMGAQLEILEQSQVSLWQQMQEQGLYLQTLALAPRPGSNMRQENPMQRP